VVLRISGLAFLAIAMMTFATVYIGPGVGVEANTVTLQTTGKTLMMTVRDIVQSARYYLTEVKIFVV
jgi:hypothetical protein